MPIHTRVSVAEFTSQQQLQQPGDLNKPTAQPFIESLPIPGLYESVRDLSVLFFQLFRVSEVISK